MINILFCRYCIYSIEFNAFTVVSVRLHISTSIRYSNMSSITLQYMIVDQEVFIDRLIID